MSGGPRDPISVALRLLARAGYGAVVLAGVGPDGETFLRSTGDGKSTPAQRRVLRGRIRRRVRDLARIDAVHRGKGRRGR